VEDFNMRNLCFKGRFGWQTLDTDRLTEPMVKRNGQWVAIDWAEAAGLLKDKLAAAGAKTFTVSPDTANEEVLMLREAARNADTELVSHALRHSLADEIIRPAKHFAEMADAEAIVLVGTVSHTLRTLARHWQRNGQKLVVIDSEETAFNHFADHLLNDSDLDATLEGLRRHHCNGGNCQCACSSSRCPSTCQTARCSCTAATSRLNAPRATSAVWPVWCATSRRLGRYCYQRVEQRERSAARRHKAAAAAAADFSLVWGEAPGEGCRIHRGRADALPRKQAPPTCCCRNRRIWRWTARPYRRRPYVLYRNPRGSRLFEQLLEQMVNAGRCAPRMASPPTGRASAAHWCRPRR
jgi:hypothetical protein